MSPDSLDLYRLCEEAKGMAGCQWRVRLPATRCSEHGGDEATPEYWESDDGEILMVHHMDLLEASNGE